MGELLKKTAVLWLAGAALIAVLFQNCGGEVGFNETANSENPFGFGQTRRLALDPNNADNRPPIRLTTIYDNSFSTELIQTKMIDGFSSAIDQVRGFNVFASLYTTSHDQNADKPSSEATDLVSYTDTNGNDVELPAADVNQIPTNTNYVEKTVYRLSPSWFLNRQPLVYKFNDGDFEGFKDYYTRSVAALGTDGADLEQGLCTLLKKVEHNVNYADPDNLAYHLYVLATNEDDFTTLQNCPVERRRDHSVESTSTTQSCNPGDPGCLFDYQVEQNSTQTDSGRINYTYNELSMRVHFSGTRYTQKWSYNRANADHDIDYEEQETTYTYTVEKWCYKDNIQIPCTGSPDVETRTVAGSCNIASARACNSSEESTAANLAGISAGDVRTCQISCTDRWIARDLPSNRIPNNTKVCGGSSNTVQQVDIDAVTNHEGHNYIRNVTRTCTDRSTSDSVTKTNQVTSCSPASRSCNTSDRDYISSQDNVPLNEIVGSCNYTCTTQTRTGSHNLPLQYRVGSGSSCTSQDNTSFPNGCTSAQSDYLISKNNPFNENASFQCHTSCSVSSQSDHINISASGLTCPSTGTNCSTAQRNQAEADHGGAVNSCTVDCNRSTSSQPRCDLSNIADVNLCSDTAQLTSLCSAKGRDDLNLSTCQRGSGSMTVTTTRMVAGPWQDIEIKDLDGVTEANNVSNMIAQRLKAVHGKGFFTSFFIHPSDDPSCAAPPSLSAGTKYEDLSQILGSSNASTYPVCMSDYSPALDSVIKIAIDNVLTNFNLDIAENEVVFEVKATLLDNSVVVIPESDYEVFKKTISFKDRSILKDVKTLDFGIWSPE